MHAKAESDLLHESHIARERAINGSKGLLLLLKMHHPERNPDKRNDLQA
jgi:hypothetical protein